MREIKEQSESIAPEWSDFRGGRCDCVLPSCAYTLYQYFPCTENFIYLGVCLFCFISFRTRATTGYDSASPSNPTVVVKIAVGNFDMAVYDTKNLFRRVVASLSTLSHKTTKSAIFHPVFSVHPGILSYDSISTKKL